jgi:hypothetical protein
LRHQKSAFISLAFTQTHLLSVLQAYGESDNESDDVTDHSQAFTSIASSQAFSPTPEARKVKKLKTAKFGVKMSPEVTTLGTIEEVKPLPPVPHTTPVKDKDVESQVVEEEANTRPALSRRSRRLSGPSEERVSEGPFAPPSTSRAFGLPPPPPLLLAALTDTEPCEQGDVFGSL